MFVFFDASLSTFLQQHLYLLKFLNLWDYIDTLMVKNSTTQNSLSQIADILLSKLIYFNLNNTFQKNLQIRD